MLGCSWWRLDTCLVIEVFVYASKDGMNTFSSKDKDPLHVFLSVTPP
jgi:hypothetical protein